jgi:iron complex outermembrane receptor protein
MYEKYNFVSGLFYLYQKSDLTLKVRSSEELTDLPNWILEMDGPVTTNSLAWYIHGNYKLSNTLILFGGIRYTYEYKTINYDQFNDPLLYANLENFTDTYSKGIFSPQAGIKYKPVDDVLLYAKTSWGYKSGGWGNFVVKVVENIKLKPEYSISYEAGFKLSAFNNKIILNSALFLSKFDDYQTEIWIPIEGFDYPSYTNAAKVTTQGLEFDVNFSPVSNLSIDGSLGYVKTNYDEFNSPAPGTNYSGNRLELAPELDYSLSILYLFPIEDLGTFSVRGDFIHKGDYYWDPSNTADYYVEPYNLLDARIGYESPAKSFKVYIWGRNLTDELYMLVRSTLPLFKYAWYGMPRTFGIQVSYSFVGY